MNIFTVLLIVLLYIAINVFVFVRSKSYTYRHKFVKTLIISLHSLLLLFAVCLIFIFGKPHLNFKVFSIYFQLNFLFILIFIFITNLFIFYFIGDFLILFLFRKIKQGSKIRIRSVFHKTAMAITFCICGLMLYGYFYGVTNYKIKTYELNFKKLPASFRGFKVLQFSDTHLGSFLNYKSVEKGMLMIQEQNADIILFTGDLVNISSQEAQPYYNLFESLEAPYGKYAVLGNHDMSDYRKLDIERDSLNVNTQDIVKFLQSTGFTVLRDTIVKIFNETDSIQIGGTDNWGKPPFKAHGNPEKLFENLNPNMFTILLSHDPSFWCTYINEGTSVDLTLSGHTHGMQFGYRTKTRQWSPASIKYPTWAGIYKNQNQLLHVNPGFGFIGIPLRIGIHPEISVFILSN